MKEKKIKTLVGPETARLDEMVKGWFIGNFEPSLFKTENAEVGVKKYKAGDFEGTHYHKIATEITLILNGEAELNGIKYSEGDIIKIVPGTSVDFKAITDLTTVVVKIPGAVDDKYPG